MLQSKFPARFIKLVVGLFIYGIGVAMTVDAQLGLAPWDVLAQGISKQTALTFGYATVLVSVLVLIAWIPLRVKPGLGSVMNAVMVGLVADLALSFIPTPDVYWQKLLLFFGGMVVISFATGLYISCGMGKGPRDGLNVGIAKRFKLPFWQARSIVEITVVAIGFLLGGQVREGTLIFALGIGYMNQLGMRLFGLADKSGKV
ncbi:YitT family protein [Aquiluna sp.]|nr:YitT family protein [Aquiluna sp.]